jgi:hypothetical protein
MVDVPRELALKLVRCVNEQFVKLRPEGFERKGGKVVRMHSRIVVPTAYASAA